MPTYGQRPDDVVQDTKGNALQGVTISFYDSESAAEAGGTSLGSTTTDNRGRWRFTPAVDTELWARLPDSTIWQVSPGRQATKAELDAAIAAESASRASGLAGKVGKGEVVIDPKDYGALGNGVADDTAAWTSAVAAAPTAGATIDGFGRTYLVSSVVFRSNLVVRNANFITKSGTGNGRSPVTLGAATSSTVVSNVRFERVTVDGNRSGQTGLTSSEDGACHGFRFLGPLRDITLVECEAKNCASDGLAIFSSNSPLKSYSTGIASHIRVVRSKFNANRRHGVSADSVVDLVFDDVEMKNNGLNADGSTTIGSASDGSKGAIMPGPGTLYGNGIDVEEYDLKTYAGDITLRNVTATGNAKQGALFYQGGNLASDVNWVTRKGFQIVGGLYDAGISSASTGYAVEFTPLGANKTTGWYYDEVQIDGARFDGRVLLRAVKTARHTGGRVTTTDPSYMGLADQVQSLTVVGVSRGTKRYSLDTATIDYANTGNNELWVGADKFVPSTGTPAIGFANRHPAVLMPDAAIKRAVAIVNIPADWERATVTGYWAAMVATGGAVSIAFTRGPITTGVALATPVSSAQVFATDAGQYVPVATVLATNAVVTPGLNSVEVVRDGTAGSDTLAGDYAFLGFKITRTL